MANESLRDKLVEWVSEYPSIKGHGWTALEVDKLSDSLWEFLQDEIGPTQQKLWDDLQLARERATVAERNAAKVGDELARLIRDSASA